MSMVLTSTWPDGVTRKQVWDTSARTFTQYDATGTQTSQRPMTQAEFDQFLAVEMSQSRAANQGIATAHAVAGQAVLAGDQTQLATIKAQAIALRDNATQFTVAQLNTQLKAMAGAIATICDCDTHNSQAAVQLIKLFLGQLDDLNGA